jgi:hypothetical protein
VFWHELPNYNPQGVQLSEPGTMHASDAAALFAAPGDEDEDSTDNERGGDIDGWGSSGGSPVDERDDNAIPVRCLPLSKETFY